MGNPFSVENLCKAHVEHGKTVIPVGALAQLQRSADRRTVSRTAIPMSEPLNSFELNRLLAFIGYGNPESQVWFLGMEPKDGGDIRGRLAFERVEDITKTQGEMGIPLQAGRKRADQKVWWEMGRIMLGLQGREGSGTNVRTYLEKTLGRQDGDTMLIYLMPIPKSTEEKWGAGGVIPQFQSRAAYLEAVLPARLRYLRAFIANKRPKAILSYGKRAWEQYKKLFSGATFTPEKGFELGEDMGALVILTPHFASDKMVNLWGDVVGIIHERVELAQVGSRGGERG